MHAIAKIPKKKKFHLYHFLQFLRKSQTKYLRKKKIVKPKLVYLVILFKLSNPTAKPSLKAIPTIAQD
jgi:hypothetical protein